MADIERKRDSFVPSLDIAEKKESFNVFVDVPGAISDGIEINLENQTLTLKAKTKEPDVGGLPLIYQEYKTGDFEATLRISDSVDREKVAADLKDGVLTLTLPKTEEVKPRQIKVKAA